MAEPLGILQICSAPSVVAHRCLTDRLDRGLSQKAMADLIGVSVDVVRNLEATGKRPRGENAVRVAAHFGVRVSEFWVLHVSQDAPVFVSAGAGRNSVEAGALPLTERRAA